MGDYRVEIRDAKTGKIIEQRMLRNYAVRRNGNIRCGDLTFIPDNLKITARDATTGKIVQEESIHNIVTNAGMNLLRDFLKGDAVTGITHIGVGTGTNSPSSTDTTLGTEVFRAAITAATAAAQKLTITYTLPSASANGNSLTEAGLFTASSSGTMYARATHSLIAKTSDKVISYTWELTWV
ncbi:MAG: hypothetical protein WC375_07595 [Methanomassiliicoccales archaeon]|jgi:hypothetical protein